MAEHDMLDTPEGMRLARLYESMRLRLLDLSRRNQLLNYKLGGRSKRQLQVVDATLEGVHRTLSSDEGTLRIIPLPEPDEVPLEERTAEFRALLDRARMTDADYLSGVEEVEASGQDEPAVLERLERGLRDRVRAELGLPPRASRKEFDRAEHARRLDIEPSHDLDVRGVGADVRTLQTLLFPDELESVMEKVSAEANLAEQEMGVSTLFVALGFLEWYESDASDKKAHAPLLLLPVRLAKQKTKGRVVHHLSAREGGAEPNLSLRKYVEQNFGRQLPDFDQGDEDVPPSIDGYLDDVSTAIKGLKRWRVRRWMVLGHFAFGRFAMFADLDPERWENPIGNALVRSVVSGAEHGRDPEALPGVPEDYEIDAPEVEAVAPFLIQDADASQHSALVDVMRGKNLVVQGPPGTGKSQTITNVIANALAAGRRVLFLAEKQAALHVVKRRLDQAGLGEFCLELHSDKSSAKSVIASIRARDELGRGRRYPPHPQFSDATWAQSRREVSAYARAMHEASPDGATPFALIWQALRGRSVHADAIRAFAAVEVPPDLLDDPVRRADVRGELDVFAQTSATFAANFGDPRHSPWATVTFAEVQSYDARAFADAVLGLGPLADAALAAVARHAGLGICDEADLCAAAAFEADLGPAPDRFVTDVAGVDLVELEAALAVRSDLLAAQANADRMTDLRREDPSRLQVAVSHLGNGGSGAFLDQSPAEAYAAAAYEASWAIELATALEGVSSVLGFGGDTPASHFRAVAAGGLVMGTTPSVHCAWIGALPRAGAAAVTAAQERRETLLAAEEAWTSRLSGYSAERRPEPSELASAAATARKGGLGRAFAALTGSVRGAREMAQRLGLTGDPDPVELEALAAHVEAVAAFEADPALRLLFGKAWSGLRTPIPDILGGLKVRDAARERLPSMPGGQVVLERLLALSEDDRAWTIDRVPECERFLALTAEGGTVLGDEPAAEVVAWARQRAEALADFLAVDPDRLLDGLDATFRRAAEAHAVLTEVTRLDAALAGHALARTASLLGADVAGLTSAASAIAWVRAIQASSLQDEAKRSLMSARAAEGRAALRAAARDWASLDAARRRAASDLEPFGAAEMAASPAASLSALVCRITPHREQVADFVSLRRLRSRLDAAGLSPFLGCADGLGLEPARWVPLLDAVVAERRAASVRRVEGLAASNGSMLDARRRAFAERDLAKLKADRAAIRARLMLASPPVGTREGSRKTWTEMAMLSHEFTKSKRLAPVRQILSRAGRAVQALQPCFMMSPLSLAKFVQPGTLSFDLLVIDEASQMRPEDALGGMLRASQIVVVGDAKQLPPTDFFSRGSAAAPEEGDDELDDLDAESILEACETTFGERRRLKWHYRSRCESLIAFSNEAFYEGGLITFPMARPGSFSIDLVRVEGINRAGRNPAEAAQVAEEAVAFMRHHAELPQGDVPSLGVITVNVEQRELVLEELRQRWAGDDLVERYQEKVEAKGEPFFVKNLETVQGDERDYVFISMTYGRKQGAPALAQNFGPIARKQGHRRLNVLFTRARLRIGLFASFGSEDVRPSETSSEGVHALKRYLAYAETRGRAAVRSIGGEPDSDFEVEVATRLRARGYEVDMQVGVSSFRIDLGVRHPDHPDRFLAGVECDGAAFHSSKSARDRDRLREAMLNGLGWDLVRIWSTDWYDDPELETDKAVKRLEELRRRPPPAVAGYRALRGAMPELESPEDDEAEAEGRVPPSDDARPELAGDDEGGADVSDDDTAAGTMREVREATERGEAEDVDRGPPDGEPPIGTGSLTPAEAVTALEDLRERVVRPMSPDWEPHRSILRPAMIETFVQQRISDPGDWYTRVPQYLRSGTTPSEKALFLDRICDVVGRVGTEAVTRRPDLPTPRPRTPEDAPEGPATAVAGVYRIADPAAVARPDRERFFDDGYQSTLRAMITQILAIEGPIFEDLLVERIARAHGVQRSGGQIRKCVLAALPPEAACLVEEDGRKVVWARGASAGEMVPYRPDPTGIRAHGDVPVHELASIAVPLSRLRMDDEDILRRMADTLEIARLREVTRVRLKAALALARTDAR